MSNDEGMTKKEPANHTNRREKIPENKVRVDSRHSRANSLFPYLCSFVVKGQCEKEDSANPQQNSRSATANPSPSIGDFIETILLARIGRFKWDRSLEDVHMNIEAVLTKRIGAAGAKLQTARSRTDQIALDLRLYVKAEIAEVSGRLRSLQNALLDVAERHIDRR